MEVSFREAPPSSSAESPTPCPQHLNFYSQPHLLTRHGNLGPQPLHLGGPRTLHLAPVKARGTQETVADGVETTPPGGSPDATARAWGWRCSWCPSGAGPGRVQGRMQGGAPRGARGAWGGQAEVWSGHWGAEAAPRHPHPWGREKAASAFWKSGSPRPEPHLRPRAPVRRKRQDSVKRGIG